MFVLVITVLGHANAAINREIDTWGMYQANAQHTGFVPIKVNPNKLIKRWRVSVGDASTPGLNYRIHQASIGKRGVYVARNNYVYSNTLEAFSIKKGKRLWTIDFKELALQPTAYHDGKIFVQTVNNSIGGTALRVFDERKGHPLFEVPFSAQWQTYNAPLIDGGVIYADAGYSGGFNAYDEKEGELKWRFSVGTLSEGATPALTGDLLVYYNAGSLLLVDKNTGKKQSDIKDPNYAWGGYTDPTPVIATHDTALIVINHTLTQFNLKDKSVGFTMDDVSGYPSVDNKYIYIIKAGLLSALDKKTGELAWQNHDKSFEGEMDEFVVTKNLVLVSDSKGISAISKRGHHKTLWQSDVHGKMSLSQKGLFIVSHDGTLTAFSFE